MHGFVRVGVFAAIVALASCREGPNAAANNRSPASGSAPTGGQLSATPEAAGEWIMAPGDYANTRFSTLTDINATNIAQLRALEFTVLNCWWDTNAYGSIVWTLLGIHTAHILTDLADTLVLGVMLLTGPLDANRFVDVSENAFYWYFVVLSWLPIYGLLYLAPRFL